MSTYQQSYLRLTSHSICLRALRCATITHALSRARYVSYA